MAFGKRLPAFPVASQPQIGHPHVALAIDQAAPRHELHHHHQALFELKHLENPHQTGMLQRAPEAVFPSHPLALQSRWRIPYTATGAPKTRSVANHTPP